MALPALARAQQPGPTDAEIAHIAVTANQIDIDMAKLAQSKSRNQAVLQFARMMAQDHASVIDQATTLVQALHVTPADNTTSRALQQGATEARARLQPLSGAAFDVAYADREVAYHQAVIDAVTQVLVPGAKNPQLKALLEKVEPVLEAHLREARQLRASVGK